MYDRVEGPPPPDIEDRKYMRDALGHYLAFNPQTVYHLASMPRTLLTYGKAFMDRKAMAEHPERRHPEYRYRVTMAILGKYWEQSTTASLRDNPLAAEAALIFINYSWALDDFMDEGPARDELMSLRSIEEQASINGYNCRNMSWHFVNSVYRGTTQKFTDKREARLRAEAAVARVSGFTETFYGYYRSSFAEAAQPNYTVEEALQYRDSVSGEMGRVVADLLSIMSGVEMSASDRARKDLGMVGNAAQLHDEWWDLVPELESGKNILGQLLREHPDELSSVKAYIAQTASDLVPFTRLRSLAPQSVAKYYEIYKSIVATGDSPAIKKDMLSLYRHLLPITKSAPTKLSEKGLVTRTDTEIPVL